AATHISVSAPAGATAGIAFPITVTALDPYNNADNSYAGTVDFSSADPLAATPAASTTLVNGVRTLNATLETSGPWTITAKDHVTSSIQGTSNAITVSAAATDHFTFATPASVVAGVAFNVTATARDQFQNVATSYNGTANITTNDAAANPPAAPQAFSSGVVTFSAILKTVAGPAKTITATDGSV